MGFSFKKNTIAGHFYRKLAGGGGPAIPAPVNPAVELGNFLKEFIKIEPTRLKALLGDVGVQGQVADAIGRQQLALQSKFQPQQIEQQLAIERKFGPEISGLQREAVKRDIANAAALGPSFREQAEDPQTRALRTELGRQVEAELALGSQLDPQLRREIEQGIRSGQSARGLTRGPGAVNAEAFAKGARGEQLRRNRQSAAQNFIKLSSQTAPNVFAAITGRNPVTGLGQQFQSPIPQNLSGSQQYAQQLLPGQIAGEQQFRNQKFNLASAQAASKKSGLGTLLGGAAGFALGGPAGAAVGSQIGGQLF